MDAMFVRLIMKEKQYNVYVQIIMAGIGIILDVKVSELINIKLNRM